MTFIQLIEMTTQRVDEIEALAQRWQEETEGRSTARRATLTEDRERPGTYVQMVEFDSFEDAMANSEMPETGGFAQRLMALCDTPPTFRNLNVLRVDEM
jgi:hypothetical protein